MTDYGPNTPHVEALLAQVRAMTPEQVRGAWRAWHDGDSSGWLDAHCAIGNLVGHDIGVDRVWLAAPGHAKNPTVDAYAALVARDLITPDGPWDQAAYDLLTGPLRKAGITVHPDDPALEDQ